MNFSAFKTLGSNKASKLEGKGDDEVFRIRRCLIELSNSSIKATQSGLICLGDKIVFTF